MALSWWYGLTRRNRFDKWRRKRRHAVSPVIAELLLIVITVAIGTLVYSFASTAFGGFGSGFSNLVQNAGQQLSENIAIEKVFFYNGVNNNTACMAGPGTTHCGGVMYVRNVGLNPVEIDAIYLGNLTSASSPAILTVPSSTPSCSSNSLLPSIVGPPAQNGQVCFFTFNSAPPPPYLNNFLPPPTSNALANEIMPGQVSIIHFMLADSSFCTALDTTPCTVAFGGTTYAITIVTARGNAFVAYETA